ncbi:MAG: nitric oxide reductase activation protein NorD [Eubacteriales bacterium]|nr:nitric oxide reductase activation protein NorD [Eubacteriales bacterium]
MGYAYKLKMLLDEKKSKFTDRDIFPTPFFAGYLKEASRIFYERFKIKDNDLEVLWNESPKAPVACTSDNKTIINAGSKVVQQKPERVSRYKKLLGLKFHEDGHRLFTNFMAGNLYKASLLNGDWFPGDPDVTASTKLLLNKASLEKYVRTEKKSAEKLADAAMYINNCIEDGRIEDLLYVVCSKQGDFINGLNELREDQYETMPTFAEMKHKLENQEGYYTFNMITQMILCYAKFSEFKGMEEEDYEDEIVKPVLSVTEYIDEMISSTSAINSYQILNKILITLWPQLEEYFNSLPEPEDNNNSSESGSTGSSGDNGNSGGNSGGGNSAVSNNLSQNTVGTSEAGSSNSSGMDEDELEKAVTAASGKSTGASGQEEAAGGHIKPAAGENGMPDGGHNEITDITKEEAGRIPFHETNEISRGSGEATNYDREYEDFENKMAAKQLEDLMNKIAESKVDTDKENELSVSLQKQVKLIDFTNSHKNCSFEILRPKVNESYRSTYNSSCIGFSNIAKEIARRIKPLLEMEDRTGYAKNKYNGSKFNAASVVNGDFKYFSQLKVDGESPTLAVALRVDESGSMGGCERAVTARAAAVTLWEFCKECHVPIAIYGDTASSNPDVTIIAYADYDKPDDNDRYRLMGIQSRSGNRDGAAIQYVAERLLKTDADVKLMIIISDGQPAASGYSGSAAEEDMKHIVRDYSRKGITFLAAAIGSDKDAIKRIYGADRFLDITNLKELPKNLTMIVKRHIEY